MSTTPSCPTTPTPTAPRQPRRPALRLEMAGRDDGGRLDLEETVRDVFRRCHGADVTHFHDRLLGLRAGDELLGVIGTTSAADSPRLFVEAYLDRPVEQVVSARARCRRRGTPGDAPRPDGSRHITDTVGPLSVGPGEATETEDPVGRAGIAEVGNLAARRPAMGMVLVATLARVLAGEGSGWTVFAATRPLRVRLRRFGVPLLDLGEADGRRLGDDLPRWGTYYDTDPRVVAARLEDVLTATSHDPRLDPTLGHAGPAGAAGSRRARPAGDAP